jgi:hypothetical protein
MWYTFIVCLHYYKATNCLYTYYYLCTHYMYYYPVLVENGVPNNLPLALVENAFLWPDL